MYRNSIALDQISPEELRDLDLLCAPHTKSSTSNFLNRTVVVWEGSGRRICSFVKQLLTETRKGITRAAQQSDSPLPDLQAMHKIEDALKHGSTVMGLLTLPDTCLDLAKCELEIRRLTPSLAADDQNRLQLAMLRRAQLLKKLGWSSTFLGLNLTSQVLGIYGGQSAQLAGQILGSVNALLALHFQLQGLKKVVQRRGALNQEEVKIRRLAAQILPRLNSQMRESASRLLKSRHFTLQKQRSDNRFKLITSLIGLTSTLIGITINALHIAGCLGFLAAGVAIPPLNIAALALAGIALACLACRYIYLNRSNWMLDIRQVVQDWQTQNQKRAERGLLKRLATLHQRADSLAKETKVQRAERKLQNVTAKIERLGANQRALRAERVQLLFQKTFGGPKDLASARLLKDSALALRGHSEGREFLRQFFRAFGKTLPTSALEGEFHPSLEEALAWEKRLLEGLPHAGGAPGGRAELAGELEHLARDVARETKIVARYRAQLQSESREAFLLAFQNLFATA